MKLALSTWPEVEAYLGNSDGILLPVGSTEQHGPMGLIGTDALCAEDIAGAAGTIAGGLVAPTLAYTPAPFNTHFPGTVSVSDAVFGSLVTEICNGLAAQGFTNIYILNAHGANLTPLNMVAATFRPGRIRIQSWWSFPEVNTLRTELYGAWEGLHATPSEVAITQATHRIVPPGAAKEPPRQLDATEIMARAGDNHGPPDRHRREFPDGRVGAHSALASPEDGQRLLYTAARAVAQDYRAFLAAAL